MLDQFYNLPLKNQKFIDRKFKITAAKTLIIGTMLSGKTSLIIDFLSNFKNDEFLYINLDDIRIERTFILENLPKFLAQNPQIKILVIENFIPTDKIPPINLNEIIISTSFKNIDLENFFRLDLDLLDYEEFIAFFPKKIDLDSVLKHYLDHGRGTISAFLEPVEAMINLQNKLKIEFSKITLNILKECTKAQNTNISAFEIYNNLKITQKISKDSVYAAISELENRKIISLISKFNEHKSAKKLFFNDFALKNALSFKKDFNKNFTNVIFCELTKYKDEIFYTKDFDFFLTKRKYAILCIPFGDVDLLFLKFKKLLPVLKILEARRLQIITMANQGELSIEGIKCEIVPFSQWALGIDI